MGQILVFRDDVITTDFRFGLVQKSGFERRYFALTNTPFDTSWPIKMLSCTGYYIDTELHQISALTTIYVDKENIIGILELEPGEKLTDPEVQLLLEVM